jgi:hypothetical protein
MQENHDNFPESRGLMWFIGGVNGGWGRNRTGVHGFAGRCITTLPPSQCSIWRINGCRPVVRLSGWHRGRFGAVPPAVRTSWFRKRKRGLGPFGVLRACASRGANAFGAGNETRTRDLNLGKVALYQLSYSRLTKSCHFIVLAAYVKPPRLIRARLARRAPDRCTWTTASVRRRCRAARSRQQSWGIRPRDPGTEAG